MRVGDSGETGEYMLGEGVPAESIRGMMSTLDINELVGIVKGGNDLWFLGGKGGRDRSLLSVDQNTSFSIPDGGIGSSVLVTRLATPRGLSKFTLCISSC